MGELCSLEYFSGFGLIRVLFMLTRCPETSPVVWKGKEPVPKAVFSRGLQPCSKTHSLELAYLPVILKMTR